MTTQQLNIRIKTSKPSGDMGTSGICIYGPSGVGKTSLLGTLEGKGLVIDVPQIEGGTGVLEDKADRITQTPIDEWNDIDLVYRYLAQGKAVHGLDWVGIDSITAFTELAKRRTLKERGLSVDPHTVALADWGKIGQLLFELLYRFQQLPMLKVWIAQERRYESQDVGTRVGPDTRPAVKDALLQAMSITARLFVAPMGNGQWEHRMRIGPHENYEAKSRLTPERARQLPAVIRDPDLGALLRFVAGKGPAPEGVDEAASTITSAGIMPL